MTNELLLITANDKISIKFCICKKKTKQSDLDLGKIVLESITQNMFLYAFNMCLGLLVETNELIKDFVPQG